MPVHDGQRYFPVGEHVSPRHIDLIPDIGGGIVRPGEDQGALRAAIPVVAGIGQIFS
jgi:hypothetical protein